MVLEPHPQPVKAGIIATILVLVLAGLAYGLYRYVRVNDSDSTSTTTVTPTPKSTTSASPTSTTATSKATATPKATAAATATPASTTQTYSGTTDIPVTFTYHKDWKTTEFIGHSFIILPVNATAETDYKALVGASPYPDTCTDDDCHADYVYDTQFDANTTELAHVEVNGLKALKTFTSDKNEAMDSVTFQIAGKNNFYTLSFFTSKGSKELSSDQQVILSSFKEK